MKALIISTMFLTSLASFAARETPTMAHLDSECTHRATALKLENDPNLRVDELNAQLGITSETGSAGK